jgi:nitrite reductase/ring-hydroxylating ferredoxin subunit/Fe-S cluster biogenesis protein NfuA
VRPMLASHGGNVGVVRIEPPRVEVQLTGTCGGCAASALTMQAGVKRAIQDACPEITEVVQVASAESTGESMRFVSPFALRAGGEWLHACSLSELPNGAMRALTLHEQSIVLFRREEAVTCFQNACAHLGLAIDRGAVADGILTCPHHGFRYDLTSGECLTAPEVQLQAHAVRVIGDRVDVRLSP